MLVFAAQSSEVAAETKEIAKGVLTPSGASSVATSAHASVGSDCSGNIATSLMAKAQPGASHAAAVAC